jgi:tetratricopeptide (TPR) repeat protein
LEELTPHPEQQTIVASYAGEIWYGAQRQSDALNIWGTWLTPNQKIDKASRLYQAGQAEDALLLVHTLDLENRVESGIRRSNLNQILVDAAQKQVTAGNDDSAELYWRWAIIQFPERANYAFNLGMTFYRRERFEDALFPFQEAVRLSPESTSYQVRLAQTLIQLERIDEARAIVVNILELDPTNEIARALHEQLNNR